ncbi:MAG TPA: HEAT repeat domain-containing protein [Terriglobia bacterium]|nr:HEAT repeat domain-containing protein [Terriglobia bacterium]
MPLFPEKVIYGVLALSAALFAVSFGLIIYAVGRRVRHEQDFQLLDEFRQRLLALFAALRDGTLTYDETRAQVGVLLRPRFQLRMEQILLEHLSAPADAPAIKRMVEDLGFVDRWRQGLQAPHGAGGHGVRRWLHDTQFSTRALNAENLGLIGHQASWKLLCQCLCDPNLDVQRVALRSLAAIGEPGSFPVLVEHLQKTVAQPRAKLSERDLLAALACFPLGLCGHLLPLLRHSNPTFRRLALQILIEMTVAQEAETKSVCLEDVERGDEIAGLILSPLADDPDAEIRARAAHVLAYVRNERAAEKLRRLLKDEAWFVRLHTIRSLARRRDAGATALLAASLTEAHWRVREAAARALSQWGAPGVYQLVRTFQSTRDVYAREQIAEELETSGEFARMLARCAESGAGPEFEVLKEIVRMRKLGYFQADVKAQGQASERAAVLATLSASSHSEVKEWANQMQAQ